jgi:hypothetical protein
MKAPEAAGFSSIAMGGSSWACHTDTNTETQRHRHTHTHIERARERRGPVNLKLRLFFGGWRMRR